MLEQITKKQHYVPQFYLRQWVDETGCFYPIKIKTKIPPKLSISNKKSNPKNFCFEKFFYAQYTGQQDDISQFLEKNFADIEKVFSEKLSVLENKILNNQQITNEDKYHLSEFMIFFWLKGKEYRLTSQKISEDAIKQINKLFVYDIDRIPEAKAKMKRFGLTKKDMIDFAEKGEYKIEFGNMHHLALMKDMYGFCNLLSAKYWKVYISRNGEFITSDTPYLDMATSKGFWGNDFLSREQSFVLSPKVIIIAQYPKNKSGKKIVRKDISSNKSLIQGMNYYRLMNSIQFGFHRNKQLLKELQEYIELVYNYRKLSNINRSV